MKHLFIISLFILTQQVYFPYYKEINKVESLIRSKEYGQALNSYKELFALYPNNRYQDVYNAAVCALKSKSYDDAYSLLKRLVLLGYTLEDIEKDHSLSMLMENTGQWEEFLSQYPDLLNQYQHSENKALLSKYLEMFELDQEAAASRDLAYQDSVFYDLSQKTAALIKTEGFPSLNGKGVEEFRFRVMVQHYCGLYNRIIQNENKDEAYHLNHYNPETIEIPALVTQALNDGLLSPEIFVSITSYWDNTNPYGNLAIRIDYYNETVFLFLQNITPDKIDMINARRESIGLPSLAENNDDFLKNTWYKDMPFKEIKEAWINCDSCTKSMDYYDLARNISFEIRSRFYADKINEFKIEDYNEINQVYLQGVTEFLDEAQRDSDDNR